MSRTRLTKKNSAGYGLIANNDAWCDEYCHTQSNLTCRDCAIYQAHQKLGEYEDLEDKIGITFDELINSHKELTKDFQDIQYLLKNPNTNVYQLVETHKFNNEKQGVEFLYIVIPKLFEYQMIPNIGKYIFLSKEEAESKALELNNKETPLETVFQGMLSGMRDATKEEQERVNKYIEYVSGDTGKNFYYIGDIKEKHK